jgi:hypothetical protein
MWVLMRVYQVGHEQCITCGHGKGVPCDSDRLCQVGHGEGVSGGSRQGWIMMRMQQTGMVRVFQAGYVKGVTGVSWRCVPDVYAGCIR